MTTIDEQQQISAILTAIMAFLATATGSAILTSQMQAAIVLIVSTMIVAVINHFQTATTTVAA